MFCFIIGFFVDDYRLKDLNEVHRRHKADLSAGLDEIDSLKKDCERIKEEAPKRGERFRFYQDLRGYVTDLVECLDEKVGPLLFFRAGHLEYDQHF